MNCNRMKKIITMVFAAVMMVLLTACSGEMADFDSVQVTSKAEEVARYCIEDNYEAVAEMFHSDYNITGDDLRSRASEYVEPAGALVSIERSAATETESDELGPCAVCVVNVLCEKKQLQFTITFDQDLNLLGVYL